MADAFDLDMRAISAVLDDDDYVLHSLMCDVEGGDNRKRRRNGWQRLQPHQAMLVQQGEAGGREGANAKRERAKGENRKTGKRKATQLTR